MKKSLISVVGILFLTGCVSLEAKKSTSSGATNAVGQKLADLGPVLVGMTRAEVQNLVAAEAKIGYQKGQGLQDPWSLITFKNPARSETFEKDGKQYLVEYYLTEINDPDGFVADDELTPLVFEDNILKAKGWDDLIDLNIK